MSETLPRDEVFRRLYAEHFSAVLGYALRRVDRPEDAADVAADTFLVAWRRLAHVPPGDGGPALVVRRGPPHAGQPPPRRADVVRRSAGASRGELSTVVPDASGDVVVRADVAAAMRRLSGRDQEVLELHLWEGLEPREIAEVLGPTTVVVRPRLSRARARLRDLLGNDPPPAGHDTSRPPHLARKEH